MKKFPALMGCASAILFTFTSQSEAAVSFVFTYSDATWTAPAKAALQDAANTLASYLTSWTATVPMNVTGSNDPASATLASAGAQFFDAAAGFGNRGAVAELILTNGAYVIPGGNPAGNVNANFGHTWSFGGTAGAGEVDFTSTMIHELGHALGFNSGIAQNGGSALGDRAFTPFDQSLSDGTGTAVVSLALPTGTGPTWTAASIGGTGTVPATPNSGLYFKGTNAVAANGGNLVPLFSPTTWSSGSSGSHMDDAFYIGGNKQLMNSATGNGPGIRTFSPLEVGIFKDIGYTTFGIPEPASNLLFGLGALMMFRRHRAVVL